MRSLGFIVVSVASTGMAASLIDGGKTVQCTFSLSLPLVSEIAPKIKKDSEKGKLLINAKLMFWDECTMLPSYAYNSVDILLKDLMSNDLPFGGKTVLIAGDFRQTLPIYKHGTPADVLGITIKNSKIWNGIKKYALTINMRADKNEIQYKNYQLQVGDGEIAC